MFQFFIICHLDAGEYSCLTVDLTFKREFSYYLLTIYVPCCMLVIVSWVSIILLSPILNRYLPTYSLMHLSIIVVIISFPKDAAIIICYGEIICTICIVSTKPQLLNYGLDQNSPLFIYLCYFNRGCYLK